jgi:hypothetical protein
LNREGEANTVTVFDATRPGPSIRDRQHATGTKAFVIEATDGITSRAARPIRNHELLTALGYELQTRKEMTKQHKWEHTYERITDTAPSHTLAPLFTALQYAETRKAEQELEEEWKDETGNTYGEPTRAKTLTTRVINRWTTLPTPTTEMWQQATDQDPDLHLIKTTLMNNAELQRAPLENKRYHKEWAEGKLEVKDGIIFQLEEPKASRIRQLQRRVVPKSLIPTILAAYHATPLAGHTGLYKTYWRIAARYWWPGMSTDVREAVLNCGHCRLANATSHHAQQVLKA